jgi:hypothetical protein
MVPPCCDWRGLPADDKQGEKSTAERPVGVSDLLHLPSYALQRATCFVNTFVYDAFGQGGGEKHKSDPKIAAYQHNEPPGFSGELIT